MAYSSGAATTKNQLLDAIQAFAVSNGWTLNYAGADGANQRLHISKSGCYANFSTNYNTATAVFGLCGSAGFTGSGSAWNAQTAPVSSIVQCDLTVGAYSVLPCTYHLFAQDDILACMIVGANNTQSSFVIGTMEKVGAFTGGAFVVSGTNMITFGTASTVSTVGNAYMLIAGSWVVPYAYSVIAGIDTEIGNAPLMPVRLFHSSGGGYVLRGYLPSVRVCGRNAANGDELVYGADTWKLFYSSVPTSAIMLAFKK